MRRLRDLRRKSRPAASAPAGKEQISTGDQTLIVRTGAAEISQPISIHPGLVVIQGLEIGRQYRLRRPEMILGRDEGAHLRIPDERISRRHALLRLTRDGHPKT